jgi:phosphatidylserine/phosphatidylglycerophosphate/cardiolipin synthase-like enzyme
MPPPFSKNELVIGPAYTDRIIELVEAAKVSIFILMFDWRWYKNDFSCEVSRVNHALVKAVRRGVSVRGVVNYKPIIETLEAVGIKARHWADSRLLHAKMLVIDGSVVVLGSHNLTMNALTQNVEVSAVFSDTELANQATALFDAIWRS